MTKFLAPLLVVSLILGGVIFVYNQRGENSHTQNFSVEEAAAVVEITSNGFLPEEITIRKDEIVVWVNKTGEHHWPASDIHPTHTIYSEFDPKSPISPGESWGFRFERVGKWQYHDHLKPNKRGTVMVEE